MLGPEVARRLPGPAVKLSREMMDRAEPEPSGDFFDRHIGQYEQLLGLLQLQLAYVLAGRNAVHLGENFRAPVAAHMELPGNFADACIGINGCGQFLLDFMGNIRLEQRRGPDIRFLPAGCLLLVQAKFGDFPDQQKAVCLKCQFAGKLADILLRVDCSCCLRLIVANGLFNFAKAFRQPGAVRFFFGNVMEGGGIEHFAQIRIVDVEMHIEKRKVCLGIVFKTVPHARFQEQPVAGAERQLLVADPYMDVPVPTVHQLAQMMMVLPERPSRRFDAECKAQHLERIDRPFPKHFHGDHLRIKSETIRTFVPIISRLLRGGLKWLTFRFVCPLYSRLRKAIIGIVSDYESLEEGME